LTFIDLRDPAGSLALLQLIFGQDASAIINGLGSKLPARWRQKFEEYGLAEYLEFPMSVGEFEQSVLRTTHKFRPTVSEKLVAYLSERIGHLSHQIDSNHVFEDSIKIHASAMTERSHVLSVISVLGTKELQRLYSLGT